MTGLSEREAGLIVDTPVATPAPKRRIVSRRLFLAGGFWSGVFLGIVGLFGAPLDFMWPRKLSAFGAPYPISASNVPPPGSDPVRFPIGRFYLANLEPGQDGSPGGLLALYQKCTHLGCTVPWRPDFVFQGTKGWFRCPCHGSTYTKGAALLVFGPAPRPLDIMAVEVQADSSIIVNTGKITKGSAENPLRAVPYTPKSTSR